MERPRYNFPRWFFPLFAAGIVGMAVCAVVFLAQEKYVLAAVVLAGVPVEVAFFVRFWRLSARSS